MARYALLVCTMQDWKLCSLQLLCPQEAGAGKMVHYGLTQAPSQTGSVTCCSSWQLVGSQVWYGQVRTAGD